MQSKIEYIKWHYAWGTNKCLGPIETPHVQVSTETKDGGTKRGPISFLTEDSKNHLFGNP